MNKAKKTVRLTIGIHAVVNITGKLLCTLIITDTVFQKYISGHFLKQRTLL